MTPIFSIVLIITLAIATFLIFTLISNLRRYKKTERLLAAFEKAAAGFRLSISKRDVLGNAVIGLDEEKNKLLFLQFAGDKPDQFIIDLEKIKSCRVYKTYVPFWIGRTKMGVLVETIALQFTYNNGVRPLILPFYNKRIDPAFDMKERAEQATQWQTFLRTLLTKKL